MARLLMTTARVDPLNVYDYVDSDHRTGPALSEGKAMPAVCGERELVALSPGDGGSWVK